ncbi:signal peptidase I [Klenkia sp. LSe6-5]|uniref:Signal peptidase I n=1 Tax=Klenkia sesuvii TaxID=3103137 RepID=A0ABU8DV56_9ACTN
MTLLLAGLLVPVAALTFSVEVVGTSMEPTVHPGDRLLVDVLAREDISRFDLVEATVFGSTVVKRVIGLPGDRIEVRVGDEASLVLLTPSGTTTTYRVDNPAWTAQAGTLQRPCCAPDGSSTGPAGPVVVPPDHFWVIGDNWGASDDSRVYGFVPAQDVVAQLDRRILPLDRAGVVPSDVRLEPAAVEP